MFRAFLGFERLGELDTPLILKFGHAKKGSPHDGDDERCKDAERSLPDVLSAGPLVLAQAIEGSDQSGTDDDANDQTQDGAKPYLNGVSCEEDSWSRISVIMTTYLAPEPFVSGEVIVMAKSLLDESQQDGDNDASL